MYNKLYYMKKIATHNSCTGEKGYSWRKLFTLFSRCQNKTIIEQYDVGVRYFDIRIKRTKRGFVAAHGLWESKEDLYTLLERLNNHAESICFISICYEGERKDAYETLDFIYSLKTSFDKLIFIYYAVKKPEWTIIETYHSVLCEQCYKVLDFSSWHTLIPVPILWKQFFFKKVEFNDKQFKMVDFV